MENENVGGEVNNISVEEKSKSSDKKMIVKIVVGVLIFLALIGIAGFLFVRSMMSNAVDSIVGLGTSLVDDAMDNSSDIANQVQSNIKDTATSIKNSANTKTAITADTFAEIMQQKGYEVGDVTIQFAQYGDYMKKAYGARTSTHQIEFYELSTVANAMDMYNTNKNIFESQKGGTSSYSTVSKGNYNTYTLTTNGKYKYICRVDNTFIYMDVAEEYKDVVKNIVSELGY